MFYIFGFDFDFESVLSIITNSLKSPFERKIIERFKNKANDFQDRIKANEMPQKEAVVDDESQQKKLAKHDASNAADLEKVTDFHEEQEFSGGDLETALKAITEKRSKEVQKRVEHLQKLAAVKINKEDVELIVREMEIPKLKAETCLRQANGDVVQALQDLIDN